MLKKLFKKKKPMPQVSRLNPETCAAEGIDRDTAKVLNLLNYTKTSGSAYNGDKFEVGYHSVSLNNQELKGQRNPKKRFEKVNLDFTGKTVLDVGCNQGGMLFEIADAIKHGIGIDFDSRMINVANRIKRHKGVSNTDFYVFDLAQEKLEYIQDFLIGDEVDVCFLLSICMWIPNWTDVIDFCHGISKAMIFETNGKAHVQEEQYQYLLRQYAKVSLLSATSDDDESQKKRKLYYCQK